MVQRGSRARRFIGYPTDRMLAVVGDAGQAAAAAASIRAAGIPDRDITLLRGSEGADRLDGTGAANGVLARIRRLTSFTLMDQLVDMAAYERAVRDGSVVLMVRVRGDALKAAVLELRRKSICLVPISGVKPATQAHSRGPAGVDRRWRVISPIRHRAA